MRRYLLCLGLMFGSVASAQSDAGPAARTWGVEAGTNSRASLLRFRSPTSAWLLGVEASYSHENLAQTSAPTEITDRYSMQLRVGTRRYSRTGERVRPFSTFSVIGGIAQTFGHEWNAGAAEEIGAAYLSSQHVSLGASGELGALYRHLKDTFPSGNTATYSFTAITFGPFRLLGAVYF